MCMKGLTFSDQQIFTSPLILKNIPFPVHNIKKSRREPCDRQKPNCFHLRNSCPAVVAFYTTTQCCTVQLSPFLRHLLNPLLFCDSCPADSLSYCVRQHMSYFCATRADNMTYTLLLFMHREKYFTKRFIKRLV